MSNSTGGDSLLAKHKVVNVVTELIAEKLNSVLGTHDTILLGYLEDADPEWILTAELDDLRGSVGNFIGVTGIWE